MRCVRIVCLCPFRFCNLSAICVRVFVSADDVKSGFVVDSRHSMVVTQFNDMRKLNQQTKKKNSREQCDRTNNNEVIDLTASTTHNPCCPTKKQKLNHTGNSGKQQSLPKNRVYDVWHKDQWITGPGKCGYRGVGADKTIKSRPWRCKYKQQQDRFALMEDAVEHYYRQSQKDNKKLDVKTI